MLSRKSISSTSRLLNGGLRLERGWLAGLAPRLLAFALLSQANVFGQLGFHIPYSDHDLTDPGTVDTFKLHSNPGASKVIYMDFNGHIAPEWGDFVYAPYDFDGNPNSFSDAEKREIRLAWQSVAEDFLPFDVDVTTEDPGIEGLRKLGDGDTEWGIRAVVSDTEGSSGWAYVDSFNADYDRMLYAGYGDPAWLEIADMVSHEAGHSVGLHHDGPDYWGGHGTPGTATYYAPIMGWTNYGPSTWDQGVYDGADNQQDDLNVITTQNGFDYRADDHGSSTGSATPITNGLLMEGIIERNTDLDYFSFTMSSAGQVTIDINPNAVGRDHSYGTGTVGANLDILAEIRDAGGNVIHTSNPPEILDASFDVHLPAGNYFLSIDGTGKGNPATNGYSDYGSLGYYSLVVDGVAAPFAITEIIYNSHAEPDPTVTLTWRKTGAASYIAALSHDLINWDEDLDDSLTADDDEKPEDIQHITVTFPLEGDRAAALRLFFRIEEG